MCQNKWDVSRIKLEDAQTMFAMLNEALKMKGLPSNVAEHIRTQSNAMREQSYETTPLTVRRW